MKKITDAVEDADLVLLGIGEEFQRKEDDFKFKEYIFDERVSQLKHYDFYIEVLKKKYYENNKVHQVINAYNSLAQLCEDKNYYVLSTCYDDLIFESALKKERIVTPCGGRRKVQADSATQKKLLSTEEMNELENKVVAAFTEKNYSLLLEIENHYKENSLSYNCIINNEYNEEGYLEDWNRYLKWLQGTVNKNLCVLELGVGLKFPSVIRWPFEKVVFYNQKASFFRVHEQLYQMTAELSDRGESVKANSVDFCNQLFE